MQIAVIAGAEMQLEFKRKIKEGLAPINYINNIAAFDQQADVLFFLLPEEELPAAIISLSHFKGIIVANAVIHTLDVLPENYIRINAWPGFINRPIVEVAANAVHDNILQQLFSYLQWEYTLVSDVAGFIAARVVAMIVNEAYYALEDDISTRDDIDTAMKLGTNYPFGPFEWGDKIGLNNISGLLNKLAIEDERYVPSTLLLNERKS